MKSLSRQDKVLYWRRQSFSFSFRLYVLLLEDYLAECIHFVCKTNEAFLFHDTSLFSLLIFWNYVEFSTRFQEKEFLTWFFYSFRFFYWLLYKTNLKFQFWLLFSLLFVYIIHRPLDHEISIFEAFNEINLIVLTIWWTQLRVIIIIFIHKYIHTFMSMNESAFIGDKNLNHSKQLKKKKIWIVRLFVIATKHVC